MRVYLYLPLPNPLLEGERKSLPKQDISTALYRSVRKGGLEGLNFKSPLTKQSFSSLKERGEFSFLNNGGIRSPYFHSIKNSRRTDLDGIHHRWICLGQLKNVYPCHSALKSLYPLTFQVNLLF